MHPNQEHVLKTASSTQIYVVNILIFLFWITAQMCFIGTSKTKRLMKLPFVLSNAQWFKLCAIAEAQTFLYVPIIFTTGVFRNTR